MKTLLRILLCLLPMYSMAQDTVTVAGIRFNGSGVTAAQLSDSLDQIKAIQLSQSPDIGGDHYVATWGSDAAVGDYYHPWKSFYKAVSSTVAGDSIYFRGGEYGIWGSRTASTTIAYANARSGTVTNPIKLMTYPGETVIINADSVGDGLHRTVPSGFMLQGCQNWYIKGINIKRNLQPLAGTTTFGFNLIDCDSIIFEDCNTYEIGGPGFRTGSYLTAGTKGAYYYKYINCDSYHNYDPYTGAPNEPGGQADGFVTYDSDSLSLTEYVGCRAWNNTDDGFDTYWHSGVVTYDNCWSFQNGWGPGGNGFKLGPLHIDTSYTVHRIVRNCIASNNGVVGFAQNLYGVSMNLFNNTSYLNGNDGFDMQAGSSPRVIRNNIALSNGGTQGDMGTNTTSDHNSWDNPIITLSTADFLSVDTLELYRPRKSDNSLPDIDFMKLKSNSDLIDEGTKTGLNEKVQYNGLQPDLGANETGITSTTVLQDIIDGIPAPIAYWNLDETSGTTLNDYIGTNDLSIDGGGADVNETGKLGKAVRFDGTDDSLSFSGASLTAGKSELTIAFWVKHATVGSGDAIWAEEVPAGADACVIRVLSGWGTRDDGGTAETLAWPAYSYTSWNYCVFTYSVSGSFKRIYVNGVQVAATTSSIGPLNATRLYQRLGAENGSTNDLDGWLDEVSVWDVALTQREIARLYNYAVGKTYPF